MTEQGHHKSGAGRQPPPLELNPVTVINAPVLSSEPTLLVCPSCHATVETKVEYKNSTRTHLIALLLCAIGCWPCVAIPYCKNSCKSSDHHCPSCGAFLGTHNN